MSDEEKAEWLALSKQLADEDPEWFFGVFMPSLLNAAEINRAAKELRAKSSG